MGYTKKILGVGYIRVSSKAQAEEGVSLEVQETKVRKHLKDYNCSDIEIFADKGKSARTIEGRDAFIEGVRFAIENKATYFAVYDTSRFARNVEDSLKYFSLLKKNNILFLCVTSKFEDTPEGRLIFSIFSCVDEYQSNKSGEKIALSMKELHRQGRFPHTAPIGYKNIRRMDGRADIIPHPEYGELVQNGLKKYARGELDTEKELAEYLWEGGLKHQWNRKGQDRYGPQTISRMLHNRFYWGYFWNNETKEWQKHSYESLISEADFEMIQSRLKKRNRNNQVNHYKRLRDEFPLRTNMYCPKCGRKYFGYKTTGRDKRRGGYYYYDCKTRGCSGTIAVDKVHEAFRLYLESIAPSKEVLRLFEEILRRQIASSETQFVQEGENLTKKINELEKDKTRIKENLCKTNSAVLREEFERDYEQLVIDIKKLQSRRTVNPLLKKNVEPLLKEGVQYLKNPSLLWISADIKHKNMLQQWMFPEGFQYFPNEECRTQQLCLTYSIMGSYSSSVNDMVETVGIEPTSISIV